MNLGAIGKPGVMKLSQNREKREKSGEADIAMLVNGYLVLLYFGLANPLKIV